MPLKAANPAIIFMVSKQAILRAYLSSADFNQIRDFAGEHKRTLSFLTAITYDQDSTIRWRAIEALGLAASQIAEKAPEYVRVHLRRLFWLLNDESGGIGWRAPEAIGEILYQEPDLFADFIPILVNLLDMEPEDARHFRAGWLWAVSRLAAVRPKDVQGARPWVLESLDDPDPQVRGMALHCLGALEAAIPEKYAEVLQKDHGQVALYISPNLTMTSVSALADGFFQTT